MTMNTKNSALLFLCCVTLALTACSPSAESLYDKGCKYQTGDGVSVDEEKALYFYHKAANKGYAKAQYTLGNCYSQGVCALQDKTEAAAWYKKASDNGLPEAQFAYGNCLYHGDGVAEDKDEAVNLITKASEQGYEPAERFLEDIGSKEIKAGTRKVVVVNDVEFAFRYCPSGSFTMGSPKRESGREENETQRQVTLTKGFWIMETELTQKQWKAVMGSKPDSYQGDEYPVDYLSWIDCQKFCVKCSQFGLLLQLPTEAQWEYACRAGNEDASKQKLSEIAWYNNNSNGINSVGTKTPNAWGLFDMYGNVWEWCSDWYGDYPDQNDTDPTGPATGSNRVNRGGSWNSGKTFLRAARRADDSPNERRSDLGARFVIASDISASVQFAEDEENTTDQKKATEEETATEEESGQTISSGTESIQSEDKNAGKRAVKFINGVEFAFRYCPAGTFMMGDAEGKNNDEIQHRVTLTEGFWILETEISQKQWKTVMGSNPSRFDGDNLPVEDVTWKECQHFCKKCSEQIGVPVQLPTEAQWEYACRAGTTGAYAGNLGEMAWHMHNSDQITHPVGTKKPNDWGLFDMHGNVWEWCQDLYGELDSSSVTDPTGATRGYRHVCKGGCCEYGIGYCRSSYRECGESSIRNRILGFRIIISNKRKDSSDSDDVNSAGNKNETEQIVFQDSFSNGKNAGDRAVKFINDVEFAFRWCPSGTFMMGSPEDEEGRSDNELQHKVTISKGFWMMETEVSQRQWEAVMGNNPSHFVRKNFSVTKVSWNDCQDFCKKCQKLGLPLKLPTEAQWEYACRAGTTGAYAGDLDEMGVWNPYRIGLYEPNSWGIHDMHGNVSEWCEDWYAAYSLKASTDPTGPSSGSERVKRGGNFYCSTSREDCRSAARHSDSPDFSTFLLGFRCVIPNETESSNSNDAKTADGKNDAKSFKFVPGKKAGDRLIKTVNGIKIAFRWCPPGTFMMGTPGVDDEFVSDSEKQHKVTLTKGFWIMETEVTVGMFNAFVNNTKYESQGDVPIGVLIERDPDFGTEVEPKKDSKYSWRNPGFNQSFQNPVTCVSWIDAEAFCTWLSEKIGMNAQLPTEAQWEYACRAGKPETYEDERDKMAWYADNSNYSTHPVGKKKPNAWGLYDMLGNVWEWCEDSHYQYSSETAIDPVGTMSEFDYNNRGGGWFDNAEHCRAELRASNNVKARNSITGFRCVIVP